jgi:hypothetical protein
MPKAIIFQAPEHRLVRSTQLFNIWINSIYNFFGFKLEVLNRVYVGRVWGPNSQIYIYNLKLIKGPFW